MNDFANMTDSTATDPNRTGPTIGTPIIPPVRMRQNGLELAWLEAIGEDRARSLAALREQSRIAGLWRRWLIYPGIALGAALAELAVERLT